MQLYIGCIDKDGNLTSHLEEVRLKVGKVGFVNRNEIAFPRKDGIAAHYGFWCDAMGKQKWCISERRWAVKIKTTYGDRYFLIYAGDLQIC